MDTNFEHRKDRRGGRGDRDRRDPGASRPYRFAIFANADGGYVLRSPDLPGRTATVSSLDEVGVAVQSAVDVRLAEAAAEEIEQDDGLYSGKFVLRLPRTLHRQLAELAVEEGVSLNQLALTFLAEGMGRVDAAQGIGEKRRGGPFGRPGGPRGGRGRRGGHGPEGHDSQDERSPEERFEGRGFSRGFDRRRGHGMGRGHRRPDFAGTIPGAQAVDPDSPRLV